MSSMHLDRLSDTGPGLEKKVQYCGFLLRKLSGQSKFQRRFCLVKDSFFLVFKEEDVPKIKKKTYIGVKPQLAIPLSDCVISEGPNGTSTIEIQLLDYHLNYVFTADSISHMNGWIDALTDGSKLSYSNFQLSEKLIETLETQGYEKITASEKYRRMFNQEAELRQTEMENSIKLRAEHNEMQQHKKMMEDNLRELETELEALRQEMEQSQLALERTRADKAVLAAKAADLSAQTAQPAAAEVVQLKEAIDSQLREKAAIEKVLQDERNAFAVQAGELTTALRDMRIQQTEAAQELAREQEARRLAEARLRDAESSLSRLHASVTSSRTTYTEEEKTEMSTDVRQLKQYFEGLIVNNRNSSLTSAPVRNSTLRNSMVARERSQRLRERHKSRLILTKGVDADTSES